MICGMKRCFLLNTAAATTRLVRYACAWVLVGSASASFAYEEDVHQQLTFLAAKHFTRCVADTEEQALSPLQVRYVVRANVGIAQSGMFRRGFRWSYYDAGDSDGKALFGLVETRFGEQFERAVDGFERSATDGDMLTRLGRIVHFLQEVTSPAHVVPVYTSRWWRLNVGDRFDSYRVDEARVEELLEGACTDPLRDLHFPGLLVETAERTLGAVDSSIPGLPITWQAFWQLPQQSGEFGEYGPAGNRFGQRAEFDCEDERCVLLRKDPLYEDFAAAQHALAVRATAHAMLIARISHSQLPAVDSPMMAAPVPIPVTDQIPATDPGSAETGAADDAFVPDPDQIATPNAGL